MPELTTAWITLTASTRGMEADIRKAINRAERDAKIRPEIDTGDLGQQGRRAGNEFARRFESSSRSSMSSGGLGAGKAFVGAFSGMLSGAALIGAAEAAARGVVGAFTSVLETGLDFSRTSNNFQGVTRATASQMKEMQTAARALGSDTQLAGATASDAALAMTELAKAGFSVDEAMGAARGTLQLATAGQIDAAKAAEIQANAMNAFSLKASDAAHVADVFANAAVASSADIPDLAEALQQVGGVAAGFGENLDDTVAALGMLANAGVKGSDAGTLLKTTMQAITDQGNPAQGAIKALNLQLYNMDTHQFVGFRELFRQLDAAKKAMSPEDFQAETNILFGSDAMRGAMIGNADAFDTMRAALERTGAASELAGAQMQGLPGVVEGISNTMEGIKLSTFSAIDGIAQQMGGKLQNGMQGFLDYLNTHQADVITFFTELGAGLASGAAAIAAFTAGSSRLMALWVGSMTKPLGAVLSAVGDFGFKTGQMIMKIPGMGGVGKEIVMAAADAQIAGAMLTNLSKPFEETANAADKLRDGANGLAADIQKAGAEAADAARQQQLYKDSITQITSAVQMMPDGKTIELKDNSPEVLEKLKQLGFTVQNLPDGKMTVRLEYRDPAGNVVDPNQLRTPGFVPAVPGETRAPRGGGRATGGAIFGAGTATSDSIPAWLSTGEHVLTAADVAAMGGQSGVYAFRSALHRAVGGPTDDALLANVPAGRYDASGDLVKGLGDCSSAVEDLVNLLDGASTAGRSMSTGNAAEWLSAHGFVQGMGGPGDFRVGYNGGHMQATLPDGTPFNWGSDAAAARGGVGGTGADDPAFTSHYYRPVSAMSAAVGDTTGGYYDAPDPKKIRDAEQKVADADKRLQIQEQQLRELKADAKESERMQQQADVDKAKREAADARADLEDAKKGKLREGKSTTSKSGSGGYDTSSLGGGLVSGMLQAIGLDGSLFSNPFEWPNVKSAMAAINWGGGLLNSFMMGGQQDGSTTTVAGGGGGGMMPNLSLPNVSDFLKPIGSQALSPVDPNTTNHGGAGGAAPGPAVVVNGNVGMDPRGFTQRIDAAQNQSWRRNMSAVRPG